MKIKAASASKFSALRPHSLSESAYRQLSTKIVSRELAPGSELPAERLLADALGINRGAVREAIKRLQQAGLVAVRQGGNHIVLDYQAEGGLELLPSLLVNDKGQVNPSVARAALALRASLAPDVAAAAAEKGGAKLAGELDAVVARMRATEALDALQELALEYWRLLVNAGGNIAFRLAFNTMNKTYRQVWNLLTGVMQAEFRDFDNLAELARAVRRRDRETARSCAAKHVALGTRALESVVSKLPGK